jgi:SAM-dependent methyltransferase
MGYSDGDAVEHQLLTAISQSLDVSTNSEELLLNIIDWPSEYHLSPVRHNLLRPFAFGPGNRILELGCGCGSITRYLGETGATIVSVEGSYRRAEIAAERCRDLPNVSIYCDNLADFRIDEEFDYVTLIGVLEYAPLFIESNDPVGVCLERALSFLNDEGALILAIENKLGLKYFSGCREDHVAIPYFGINDLYTGKTPVTFGRQEIARHLNRSGFGSLDFFYPFPDYKLPNLILSSQGAQSDKLNLGDLLIHAVSRDYPESHYRALADGLAWRPIADNRLLEDMANSFLIRAHKNVESGSGGDWLAKICSRSPRRPEFLVETTIEPDIKGNLLVRKHPLIAATEEQKSAHPFFRHVPTDSAYIHGKLLLRNIHLAIVREEDFAGVIACFRPWLSYLYAHETPGEDGQRMLPGNFIDCIPPNLIVTDTGNIEFIDAEWTSTGDIPMSWVLIRGVMYSVAGCLSSRILANMTYRKLTEAILERTLDDKEIALADAMERQFFQYCHTSTGHKVSFMSDANEGISLFGRLSDAPLLMGKVFTYESELKRYESELNRIKGTISWRITKPLRLLANFPKLLLKERKNQKWH